MPLSACTTIELVKTAIINLTSEEKNQAHYKVGNPYRVSGKWYYPKENPNYNEVGIASWYGSEFHDRLTANGELFDKNEVSAAHKTLPMPSIVRVKNLENGKSLLIRVNDRGPFVSDRIIDLSEEAAKRLGVYEKGTAKVRVSFDRVETAKLFSGGKPPASGVELAKYETGHSRKTDYKPKKQSSGLFIQVGSYTVHTNAKNAAKSLKGLAAIQVEKVDFPDRTFHRVKLGPFYDTNKADSVLNQVTKLGFKNAIIISD